MSCEEAISASVKNTGMHGLSVTHAKCSESLASICNRVPVCRCCCMSAVRDMSDSLTYRSGGGDLRSNL